MAWWQSYAVGSSPCRMHRIWQFLIHFQNERNAWKKRGSRTFISTLLCLRLSEFKLPISGRPRSANTIGHKDILRAPHRLPTLFGISYKLRSRGSWASLVSQQIGARIHKNVASNSCSAPIPQEYLTLSSYPSGLLKTELAGCLPTQKKRLELRRTQTMR